MVRRWPTFKLNELGALQRGRSRHRPRNDPSLYGGDFPFIQTSDVKDASLYVTKYDQTYNERGLAQSQIWPRGTLCITIAANVAETAILGIEACFPDSIVGFTPDPNRADVRFVKYSIDILKTRMQNISRGATQDNLSVDKLLSFALPCPDVNAQRRIADIVSAYDVLIENNARRIAVLEEVGCALYREWFVEFRAPCSFSKGVKVWKSVVLGQISSYINRGVAPKYSEGGEYAINQRCIRDGQVNLEVARQHATKVPADKYVRQGDILVNSTGVGTLGRVGQVLVAVAKYTVDTHVSIVRPSEHVNSDFLGIQLLLKEPEIQAMGVGSTGQTELSRSRLAEVQVCNPPAEIQAKFGMLVRPLRMQAQGLLAKNRVLCATRDLLLPKLISGELDVSHLRAPDTT